jgi:hypothetical protein
MAWLVFGWRFGSSPLQKHGTPQLHCIAVAASAKKR